jgi:hypothetical protein
MMMTDGQTKWYHTDTLETVSLRENKQRERERERKRAKITCGCCYKLMKGLSNTEDKTIAEIDIRSPTQHTTPNTEML